ncbi:type II toxin-antitoxin system death-on-curing family toxin [Calidifontibacillus erzurumensis]|uniref:Type II toxin-antitoxin system death-on-curing family toxin n=1 Tax=Calidifontibacillus erzurumensis TaxID=2741433 RepID=A0A8J8GFV8_9BACI|nr:type II toxin-antitoxin system death-on-curing family toxin [Calidifontibacillus erzurumensis]NSL52724.1 type II toxin-antitoxin system death-on-curing family toxin [Calidifontibacillus erzurumensis]
MNIEYLTVEDVEQLHDLTLEKYGGLPGREIGKLEGVLALPMSGFGDIERFPTLAEKAAVYLYYLAIGHCFVDGNKRTAYLSTFTFLDLNGFDLIVEDEELFRFMILLADNDTRPPFEVAVEWIAYHMFKRE